MSVGLVCGIGYNGFTRLRTNKFNWLVIMIAPGDNI
jgi:hypothetical protein